MLNKYNFKKNIVTILFLILFQTWCQNSYAHLIPGTSMDFSSGFLHPVTGLDHILAMLSVGMWGAVLGYPSLWALPIAFPLVMSLGAVWGIMGFPLGFVEQGIVFSVIGLGLIIALKFKPNLIVSSSIVSFFAFFHGYAHGHEMPGQANAVGYSIGFVTATGLLHLCGIGIGCVLKLPHGEEILKAMGGAISCAGIFMLIELIKG